MSTIFRCSARTVLECNCRHADACATLGSQGVRVGTVWASYFRDGDIHVILWFYVGLGQLSDRSFVQFTLSPYLGFGSRVV